MTVTVPFYCRARSASAAKLCAVSPPFGAGAAIDGVTANRTQIKIAVLKLKARPNIRGPCDTQFHELRLQFHEAYGVPPRM